MNASMSGSPGKTSPNARLIAAWRLSRSLHTPAGTLLLTYNSVVPLLEVERRRGAFRVEGVAGDHLDTVLSFSTGARKKGGK